MQVFRGERSECPACLLPHVVSFARTAVCAGSGQEDRRRVLLVLHRLRESQGVHDLASWGLEGCAERGRAQPAGHRASYTPGLCLSRTHHRTAAPPLLRRGWPARMWAHCRTLCAWPEMWHSSQSSSLVEALWRWRWPRLLRRSRSPSVVYTSGPTVQLHRRSRCVAFPSRKPSHQTSSQCCSARGCTATCAGRTGRYHALRKLRGFCGSGSDETYR